LALAASIKTTPGPSNVKQAATPFQAPGVVFIDGQLRKLFFLKPLNNVDSSPRFCFLTPRHSQE
jgi:hypothetical protein